MSFGHSFDGIITLMLMIAIGYFYSKKPWFGEKGGVFLSKLTVQLALPFYMVYNVTNTYETKEELLETIGSFPIPVLSILISMAVGYIMLRLIRVPEGRRGAFVDMCSLSNIVLIGFPVIASLFGDSVATYSLVYYMANTALFYSIGTFLLRRDAGQKAGIFTWETLKNVFSPPFVGFILGVLMVVTNIRPTAVLASVIKSVGSTASPISMLFIGNVISRVDFRTVRLDAEKTAVLLCKFLLGPLIMYLLCLNAAIPVVMKKIFIILAGMPIIAQSSILSREYGADYEFVSLMVTISTLISLITIPLMRILVEYIPL